MSSLITVHVAVELSVHVYNEKWRILYFTVMLLCLMLWIPSSLSDRSFNDIMQYPVMPWVVADYTSSSLGQEYCTSVDIQDAV